MEIKVFKELPSQARLIRKEVFVDEQGFKNEFDSIDDNAIHFLLFDENKNAAAVCRAYSDGDEKEYHIGRIAVKKECRSKGLGAKLLKGAEDYLSSVGVKTIVLSSQKRVCGFYEKLGYEKFGGEYLDEFCPHIMMKKDI